LGGKGIPDCDNMYTLTTSGTSGSIAMNPSGGVYNKDAVVTVTANPDYGYAFGSWGGDLSGSVNPTAITMNGKKNVTANFVVSNGDVTPWIETFSQTNGTRTHGAPTSWTATRSSGLFEVSSNRLMINQGSAEGLFETTEISIPNGSVKVSLEVQASGGLDSGDYVRFYKIVDGGEPVQIDQEIMGNFDGTKTLSGADITGKKLKLRITTKVTASDEYFFFDNLKVEDELKR